MSDEKLALIASRLLERTKKGEIRWDETARESTFNVSFPTYSVAISGWTDGYELAVFNESGTEVESLIASGLDDNYTVFQELYEAARRIALKSDELLDDLLARLNADG